MWKLQLMFMKHVNFSYNCFSEKGEVSLPDKVFTASCLEDGFQPIVFLDSCVCLHIIKVVEHKRKAQGVNIQRILALKEYITKYPETRIDPFFAFLELCSQKESFDFEKFEDFRHRIDFFTQVPIKIFKSLNYDFYRDFFVFRRIPPMKGDPMEPVNQILKNSYCTLLKIRSLATKGLTKSNAEYNIDALADWMTNELNIFRGAEYKLGMNIFGGNTEFRKMIGLDNKPKDVKKKLKGTAWDMFHSKFTANSFRISEILQKAIYPFFLTSDANLFKIFQNFSIEIVKDGGENFVTSFVMTSDFSYPHLDDTFIEKNNKKLFYLFVNRSNHQHLFNEEKVDRMISELEAENNIP